MDRRDKDSLTTPKLRFRMPPADGDIGERFNDCNMWFNQMFPDAARLFGPGFMQATYEDLTGLPRLIPVELNEDAWAYVLAGDRSLGHRVIFYPPEGVFYFYDPLLSAFCPTTEEKLKALVSNFRDCSSGIDYDFVSR